MAVLPKVVDKKIKVRVKYGVCNVKKLFMINWKKLKKIRQTYIDRLKILLYLFKCSWCTEYNYRNRKLEDIVEKLD